MDLAFLLRDYARRPQYKGDADAFNAAADEIERLHDLLFGVGGWISCEDRMPTDGQTVAFVVRSENRLEYLNWRVLGGVYTSGPCGGFSVPGMTVDAWFWMPMAEAPDMRPNV